MQLVNQASVGSNLDPKYIAGFFDGEGSIGIYPRSWNRNHTIRYYVLVVSLGQSGENGRSLLTKLAESFGGSVYQNTQNGAKKVMWKWNVSANKGKEFLNWMLPYLYIKREEALLGIEFQETPNKQHSDVNATKLALAIKEYK